MLDKTAWSPVWPLDVSGRTIFGPGWSLDVSGKTVLSPSWPLSVVTSGLISAALADWLSIGPVGARFSAPFLWRPL